MAPTTDHGEATTVVTGATGSERQEGASDKELIPGASQYQADDEGSHDGGEMTPQPALRKRKVQSCTLLCCVIALSQKFN